jgi:predicted Zn finger-like uncharacterized protein
VIVACPSCQTRFNLDSAKLLPAGRNVRCAKCGHRWRQMPEDMEEQPASPPPPAVEPPAPDPAAPAATAPPEEAETHPPSPPETPAEMAQSLAAIAEQVASARGESYTVSEGEPQPPAAQNPIHRLGRRAAAGGFGPITVPPRMRPMRPAKRRPYLGLILVVGLVIGLLAAAILFRDVIARTVPGADVIYSLLNLSTDNPAADLEISNITAVAVPDEDGTPSFQVTATIFNLADYPVNVPPLMLVPLDGAGEKLEPFLFRLKETVAQPGQNIKFQKSFDNWPTVATGFVIEVADAH